MIPTTEPDRLILESQQLKKYLEEEIGAKVDLSVPTIYAAVVEALVNEQVEFGEEGSLGDAKVRTISTRAGVDYDLSDRWVLTGSMTWFHQEICGDPCAVAGRMGIPELSTFRIVAGIVWYSE